MANKTHKSRIGGETSRTVSTDAAAANELIAKGQVEGMIGDAKGRTFKEITDATYRVIESDKDKYLLLYNANQIIELHESLGSLGDEFLGFCEDGAEVKTIYGAVGSESEALPRVAEGKTNFIKANGSFSVTKATFDPNFALTGDLVELGEQRITANIATSYAIDWNAASQLVLTPAAAVTLSNANLPVSPNTKVISGVFKASSFAVTFPASWKARANNDPLSATLDTHFTAETISDTVILYTLENIPS